MLFSLFLVLVILLLGDDVWLGDCRYKEILIFFLLFLNFFKNYVVYYVFIVVVGNLYVLCFVFIFYDL